MTLRTPVTKAYTAVPSKEGDESAATSTTTTTTVPDNEQGPAKVRSMNPTFATTMPQVRDSNGSLLTWSDDFFDDDDDDDIIAVFDFDYDLMEWELMASFCGCYTASAFIPALFGALTLMLVPCNLRKNMSWHVRAQHLAVTRDGIRFVHDRRPSLCGWSCTDVGQWTKTVSPKKRFSFLYRLMLSLTSFPP
jgi:hypothetical protein